MQENAREKPLVRGRIEALLRKTTDNGCTPGEARSALAKARELADRYGFAPDEFRWPVATSDDSEAAEPRSEPEVVQEPPRRARGRGIGALARELILEHPDWTYGQIAAEVNSRIEGARSTAHSVRWYSNAMRREGISGTGRVRRPEGAPERGRVRPFRARVIQLPRGGSDLGTPPNPHTCARLDASERRCSAHAPTTRSPVQIQGPSPRAQ